MTPSVRPDARSGTSIADENASADSSSAISGQAAAQPSSSPAGTGSSRMSPPACSAGWVAASARSVSARCASARRTRSPTTGSTAATSTSCVLPASSSTVATAHRSASPGTTSCVIDAATCAACSERSSMLEASASIRARRPSRSSVTRACHSEVMSRTIATIPTISPDGMRTGAAVPARTSSLPSWRRWTPSIDTVSPASARRMSAIRSSRSTDDSEISVATRPSISSRGIR